MVTIQKGKPEAYLIKSGTWSMSEAREYLKASGNVLLTVDQLSKLAESDETWKPLKTNSFWAVDQNGQMVVFGFLDNFYRRYQVNKNPTQEMKLLLMVLENE